MYQNMFLQLFVFNPSSDRPGSSHSRGHTGKKANLHTSLYNALVRFTFNASDFLLQGPTDALGISIAGGKGSPLGDIPIFIAMIQANGMAARTHRLKVLLHFLLRNITLVLCKMD